MLALLIDKPPALLLNITQYICEIHTLYSIYRSLDNRVLRDPFAKSNSRGDSSSRLRRAAGRDNDDNDPDDKDDSDEGIEVGKYRRQQGNNNNSRGKVLADVSTPRSGRQRLESLSGLAGRGKRRDSYNRDSDEDRQTDTPRSRARNLRNREEELQEEREKQERIRRLQDRSGGSSRERDHSPQSSRQKSAREREAERFREKESEKIKERLRESDRLRQHKLSDRDRESERVRDRRLSREFSRDDDTGEEMPSIRIRGKANLATPPRTPRFSDSNNSPSPRITTNTAPSFLQRPLASTSRNSRLVSPRVSTTSLDADSDPNTTAGLPLNRRFRLATINDSGSSENSDDDEDVIVVSKATSNFSSKSTTSASHAEKRLHDSDGDSQRFNNKRSTRDSEVFSKVNTCYIILLKVTICSFFMVF